MGSPVVWFEIRTEEPTRAMEFYSALFGWAFTPIEDRERAYWLISTKEGTGTGGLVEQDGGDGQAVMLYVGVEDLEATVTMATALGAWLEQPPTDISPEVGRYAILADPNGCRFGLWTPNPSRHGVP